MEVDHRKDIKMGSWIPFLIVAKIWTNDDDLVQDETYV